MKSGGSTNPYFLIVENCLYYDAILWFFSMGGDHLILRILIGFEAILEKYFIKLNDPILVNYVTCQI